MHTLRFEFEELTLVKVWPYPITCSGEAEIHVDGDEWGPGDFSIKFFRQGDYVEDRIYPAGSPEAERLSKLLLQDHHLCTRIDEQIGEELVSARELAAESRYDMARESAL